MWLSVPDMSIARVGLQALAVWSFTQLACVYAPNRVYYRTVREPRSILGERIQVRGSDLAAETADVTISKVCQWLASLVMVV